jgi:hypothetical protein
MLKMFEEMNLSLIHEKFNIIMSEGVVLGHHMSFIGIEVDQRKVKIIKHMPSPLRKKDVRSFLGHLGYYRRFIKDFRKLASPFFTLQSKYIEFFYTTECQEAFECIK